MVLDVGGRGGIIYQLFLVISNRYSTFRSYAISNIICQFHLFQPISDILTQPISGIQYFILAKFKRYRYPILKKKLIYRFPDIPSLLDKKDPKNP